MSKQTSLFLTKEIVNTGQVFVSGDAGQEKTVVAGGPNDSLVKSINIYNQNNNLVNMIFSLNIPTGDGSSRYSFPIYTVQIPANAGSGTAAVDMLAEIGLPSLPKDNVEKGYYPLSSGAEIRATFASGITPLGSISITSILENY